MGLTVATQLATALLTATIALGGCSTVTLQGNEGDARIERTFALATVVVAPTTMPMRATMRGLGFARTPVASSFGWAVHDLTVLPPGCHVVVWVRADHDAQAIRRLLGARPEVCVGADSPSLGVPDNEGEHHDSDV